MHVVELWFVWVKATLQSADHDDGPGIFFAPSYRRVNDSLLYVTYLCKL